MSSRLYDPHQINRRYSRRTQAKGQIIQSKLTNSHRGIDLSLVPMYKAFIQNNPQFGYIPPPTTPAPQISGVTFVDGVSPNTTLELSTASTATLVNDNNFWRFRIEPQEDRGYGFAWFTHAQGSVLFFFFLQGSGSSTVKPSIYVSKQFFSTEPILKYVSFTTTARQCSLVFPQYPSDIILFCGTTDSYDQTIFESTNIPANVMTFPSTS